MRSIFKISVLVCVIALFSVFLYVPDGGSDSRPIISGTVCDEKGPVAGAVLKVPGKKETAITDESGVFELKVPEAGKTLKISAWKHGYYCSVVEKVKVPSRGLRFNLVKYQTHDNPRYEWIPPAGKSGCAECHSRSFIGMSLNDAHMKAATNPRFLSMFYGTDTNGNSSPPTVYAPGSAIWNNILVPQPPDPKAPHYGPGFVLDFPGSPGTCTTCHIPGASFAGGVDPRSVKGADRYGVHCDFCHKVAEVNLNPVTKMPYPRAPGVLSMDVRRPDTDDKMKHQLFFGTFGDVDHPDTALPLLKESRYCAACHSGVFWNATVYNSYGEWLRSPYSDPKSGKAKTCQECHMPSPAVHKGKMITNIAPGKGGIRRDAADIHSHNMTVGEALLRNSLTMSASAGKESGRIIVRVHLVNDRTGHHIPSDCPLRHMILIVEARDAKGGALKQLSGPRLPAWCGTDTRKKGDYARLPGKVYAKLLKEKWTEVFPATAYWRHTELVSDNRIAPFAEDAAAFAFASPENGRTVISVRLLYRRAFIHLMEQKKWDAPDILMAEKRILLAD